MFKEEYEFKSGDIVTKYPCGCAVTIAQSQGEFGPYDQKNYFQGCPNHATPISMPKQVKRVLGAELDFLNKICEKPLHTVYDRNVLWEAFIVSLNDPAFRRAFEVNIKQIKNKKNAPVLS